MLYVEVTDSLLLIIESGICTLGHLRLPCCRKTSFLTEQAGFEVIPLGGINRMSFEKSLINNN